MANPPLAMLAELTHRCPLACPYCSNPLELISKERELTTVQWVDVFHQASDMGVLQLHLSGGEPASRTDLVDLTKAAREAGLYTNLITSGIGLTEKRLRALEEAGLDHVQLSLQGVTAAMADRIGGDKGGFGRKKHVGGWLFGSGFSLSPKTGVDRGKLCGLAPPPGIGERVGAGGMRGGCGKFLSWGAA
ncbi:MAG: radical SAM protein, partial [Arenibacterium sp.]